MTAKTEENISQINIGNKEAPCFIEYKRQMELQDRKERVIKKYLILFSVTLFVLEVIGIIFLNPFKPHSIDSLIFIIAIINESLYIIFPISLIGPLCSSITIKSHKINLFIHALVWITIQILLLIQFLTEINGDISNTDNQKIFDYVYYSVCLCKSLCLIGLMIEVRKFQICKQIQDRLKGKLWRIQFEEMGNNPLEFSEIIPERKPSNELDDVILYFTYNSQNDRRKLLLESRKDTIYRFTSLHM